MNKKIKMIVPEELLDAAYRMKDNAKIYACIDKLDRQIIGAAFELEYLYVRDIGGNKIYVLKNRDDFPHRLSAYCLPDDIEIVSEEEYSEEEYSETWVDKAGCILCPIEQSSNPRLWKICLPDGENCTDFSLGGIVRCIGYEFLGFLIDDTIRPAAVSYKNKEGRHMCAIVNPIQLSNFKPIYATHTVWRKVDNNV